MAWGSVVKSASPSTHLKRAATFCISSSECHKQMMIWSSDKRSRSAAYTIRISLKANGGSVETQTISGLALITCVNISGTEAAWTESPLHPCFCSKCARSNATTWSASPLAGTHKICFEAPWSLAGRKSSCSSSIKSRVVWQMKIWVSLSTAFRSLSCTARLSADRKSGFRPAHLR
jgi:hypothetical protein